jgi:hypothetical protein
VSIRADPYGEVAMPQWIILMTLAIVAWLVLSVGGGLVVGRILGAASRRRRIA